MSEIVSPFSKSIIIVEDQLLFKSISTLEFGHSSNTSPISTYGKAV